MTCPIPTTRARRSSSSRSSRPRLDCACRVSPPCLPLPVARATRCCATRAPRLSRRCPCCSRSRCQAPVVREGGARGARRAQPSRARARTPAATLHPGAIPHGPPRARALTACAPVFVEIERLHADERVKTSAYLWEREGHANRGEVYDGARGVRRRAGVMRDRLNARSSGVRTLGASVGALPRGTAFGFQRAAGTPRRRVGMV